MVGSVTDHLANERTFLAWVRTAITIMALGFVVARFGLFLREVAGTGSSNGSPFADGVGVLLVLAGAAVLVLAQLRFQRTKHELDQGQYTATTGFESLLTVILVVVGVGLALYLLGFF